jgi:hypothetical protein
MVGVGGAPPADQTGLRCDEFEVDFVAMVARLADGELAFLDFGGSGFGLERRRSRRVVIDGCSPCNSGSSTQRFSYSYPTGMANFWTCSSKQPGLGRHECCHHPVASISADGLIDRQDPAGHAPLKSGTRRRLLSQSAPLASACALYCA